MFEWKGTRDDLTCSKGRYIMRVEQLDTGKWWYAVYRNGSDEFMYQDTATSRNRAIGRCEGYFKGLITALEIVREKLQP